jgi:hypothetical protein
MGFDPATIQFLAASRKLGVSLDRVLSLGRQWMYIKPDHLQALLAGNGVNLSPAEAAALFADDGYCERFLKSLLARPMSIQWTSRRTRKRPSFRT